VGRGALGAVALAWSLSTPSPGLAQRQGGAAAAASKTGQTGQTQSVQSQPSQPQGSQRPSTPGRSDQFVGWEWWKDEQVKKDLALTPTQARSITRLYEDRARQMKTHSDEFQKQLEELDRMTRERSVDVATYSIQVTRVEALRTELSKTRTVMLYSIYRMLTPEQYQKLRQIRDQRRSGRGGGGAH
jgi:Spy/CpxP family protein refolding chaperone